MSFARSVLFIAAASQLMLAQGKPAIAGIWRGRSSCEQKESACREETVVYRFSPLQDKPGSFSVTADKIVDGKAMNMGDPGIPVRRGPARASLRICPGSLAALSGRGEDRGNAYPPEPDRLVSHDLFHGCDLIPDVDPVQVGVVGL